MRLYGDLARGWRFVLISALGFLSLVSLGKHVVVFFGFCCKLSIMFLGAGAMMMVSVPSLLLTIVGQASLAAITSFVNIIFATMITIRLVIHQWQMKKLLGKAYASPYNRTISIIVESCGLIAVTNLVFVSLLMVGQPAAYIPEVLMVHVSVNFFFFSVRFIQNLI